MANLRAFLNFISIAKSLVSSVGLSISSAIVIGCLAQTSKAQTPPPSPNCETSEKEKQALEQKQDHDQKYILEMSGRLFQFLESKQTKVALVARVGGDLSDRKFRLPVKHPAYAPSHKYTHMALAYKDPETGTYLFMHLLNLSDCGESTKKSALFEQSFAYFFMDDPFMFDLMVSIPSKALQEKLLRVLLDKKVGPKGWANNLHWEKYSAVANPFANDFQNSNQWILTVLAAAQGELTDRLSAQAFYQSHFYIASKADVSWYEKKWANLTMEIFTDKDHTEDEISSGWFDFVSVASVFKYLELNDHPILHEKELCISRGCNHPLSDLP